MPDYGQKATDAEFRRLRAKINDVYRQAYKEIEQKGREFAQAHARREAQLRQMVADGKMTQADFDAWMRGQVFQGEQWQKKKQQMTDTLYHADQVAQQMVNDSRYNVFAANANYMGYSLEHDAGIKTNFGLYDADSVRRLVKKEPDLLPPKKMVGKDKSYQWYNRQVQTAITQGIIQGESLDKIAHRIGKQTGETSMTAMLRNARTMQTGAQNAGRIEGLHQAQELGIKVKKQWMATLDSHTRDAHADLDGQIADVDEPFDSELGPIMYPGDPDADPANVWNCRCTLVYVYPEYPNSMERRDNETGENVGDMTYREWEEMKRGEEAEPIDTPEPTSRTTVDGTDISTTWERRPDQFDFEINDVIDAQGFDGNPRVVDADEFDRAVQESGFIAQRSYSAPDQETLDAYREQLYNGEWYVDCGTGGAQYGQGMYCAADYNGEITDGIRAEMEHYRNLGESRYHNWSEGEMQREYDEKRDALYDKLYSFDDWDNPKAHMDLREEIDKLDAITYMRDYVEAYHPELMPRSYTETLTLAPDAKIVTWREINDIRTGTLGIEYRNEVLEEELKRRGLSGDELTFARYNAGLGVSWNEVDAAARRLGAEKRNAVMEQLEDAGNTAQRRFNEEQERRRERARIYQEKYHDIGSLAAALGYDAINAENHGQSGSYTVILNRTKVIFRRP